MKGLPTTVPSGPLLFLLVGLAYLALAQYVIALNDPVYLGAGFWPAAGLTLGILLLLPTRRWPWVIAAIAVAEFGGDLAQGYPLAATLWWTAGNCVGPLVGATLIRRFGDPRGSLVPVRNLMAFLICGVLVAPLIGASVGTIGSVTSIGHPFWQVWPKYVIGDGLGVLVIAPVLLSWREPRVGRSPIESVLLTIGLTAVSVLAFRNWPDEWDVILPYLIVPFLTWAALRFGVRGAAWAVLLTANVANIATAIGYGPFAIAGEPTGYAITLLQIFLVITAATALILAALVDDLTDRRKAEAALRDSEAQLRRQAELLDKARDAIVVLDMDCRVRFWNQGAERLYGWSREDVLDRPVGRLCDVEAAEFRAAMACVLEHDEWIGPLTQQRKDGSSLTVEGHWTLVRDDDRRPNAILAINTDITQRLALEEQLRQAQRLEAVSQLSGGVAHDFNNLLMVIIGNAELLGEELHDDPRLHPLAESIGIAANRGADLVRRMLAFARRQALEPQVVDVDQRIDGMEDLLQRTLTENIAIERVREPQPWRALVDPVQLESALLNLALNARDAMPDGGRLRIETANVRFDEHHPDHHPEIMPGPYIMIAVSDTGGGIAPEHLDHVFEPFFSTKKVGKGSGLGLSMVYGFIKQSGGHVTIDSTPGRCTTVRLYLPQATTEQASPLAEPGRGPLGEGQEKILLVEDDDLVRSHVSAQLTSLGYRVVAARNGPEGLALLGRNSDVDLLFTDVIMPGGLNGPELAEAARELRPDLPVLFTSGYTEDALADHGRLGSRFHLLQKPYRRQELAAALRQVLDDGSTAALAGDRET